MTTKDYALSTGGALGDAVSRSLEGVDLTLNDALGGDFSVAAKAFAIEATSTPLVETLAARSFGKDYRAARRAPVNPLAGTFAAHSGQSFDVNAPDGLMKARCFWAGPMTLVLPWPAPWPRAISPWISG